MHKTYVTFGHNHVHVVNGQTYDKNCVAIIESEGPAEGREMAFRIFGTKFCFEYPEAHFDHTMMFNHFHRGFIPVFPEED